MHLPFSRKGGNAESKKRSDSGYILKVGLREFPDRFDVCSEKSHCQEDP